MIPVDKKLRRQFIKQIVEDWKKKNPVKYKDAIEHAKFMRKAKVNVFGTEKYSPAKGQHIGEQLRHIVSLPRELFDLLNKALDNPKFMEEEDEVTWFCKTFPEFKGHEKT